MPDNTVKRSSMDALERLAALSTQAVLGSLAAVTVPPTIPPPIVVTGPVPSSLSAGDQISVSFTGNVPMASPTAHDLAYMLGFPKPPVDGGKFSLQEHDQAGKAINALQLQFDGSNSEGKAQIEPILHVMRGLFSMYKSPVADTHGVVVAKG